MVLQGGIEQNIQLPISNIRQAGNGMVSGDPGTTWGAYYTQLGNLSAAQGGTLGKIMNDMMGAKLGNQLMNPVIGSNGQILNVASSPHTIGGAQPLIGGIQAFGQPRLIPQQGVMAPIQTAGTQPLIGGIQATGGQGGLGSATGGTSNASATINNVQPMQFTPPVMNLAQAPNIAMPQFAALGGFNAPMLAQSSNGFQMPQMQGPSGGGGGIMLTPDEAKAINAAQWTTNKPDSALQGGITKEQKAPEEMRSGGMPGMPGMPEQGGMNQMQQVAANIPLNPQAPINALQAAREGEMILAGNNPLEDISKLFGDAGKAIQGAPDAAFTEIEKRRRELYGGAQKDKIVKITDPFAPVKPGESQSQTSKDLLRYALGQRKQPAGKKEAAKPQEQIAAKPKPVKEMRIKSDQPRLLPPPPAIPPPPDAVIPQPAMPPMGYQPLTFNSAVTQNPYIDALGGLGANYQQQGKTIDQIYASAKKEIADLQTSPQGLYATELQTQAKDTHDRLKDLQTQIQQEVKNADDAGIRFKRRTYALQIANAFSGRGVVSNPVREFTGTSAYLAQKVAPLKEDLRSLGEQYGRERAEATKAIGEINDRAKQIQDRADDQVKNQIATINGWTASQRGAANQVGIGIGNNMRYNMGMYSAQATMRNAELNYDAQMAATNVAARRLGIDNKRLDIVWNLGRRANELREQGLVNDAQQIENQAVGIFADVAVKKQQEATIDAQRLPEIQYKLAQAKMLGAQTNKTEIDMLNSEYNTMLKAAGEGRMWAGLGMRGISELGGLFLKASDPKRQQIMQQNQPGLSQVAQEHLLEEALNQLMYGISHGNVPILIP